MKKIATILFFIFSLVQLGPSLSTLFTDAATIFLVDEEKSDDSQKESGKKEQDKNFLSAVGDATSISLQQAHVNTTHDDILPAPFLEKLSPPPNFC